MGYRSPESLQGYEAHRAHASCHSPLHGHTLQRSALCKNATADAICTFRTTRWPQHACRGVRRLHVEARKGDIRCSDFDQNDLL